MSQTRLSTDPVYKRATEVLTLRLDFQLYGLQTTELLTGTPTASPSSGITAGSPTVNAATFKNRKKGTCPVGKGVLLPVSGGTAGSNYTIDLDAVSDAGNTYSIRIPVYIRNA